MKTQNKITKRKAFITAALFLSGILTINAQDQMILKNGEELNVKVLEITQADVKFKRQDNLGGPMRIISKADIFSITYSNGSKDVFNNAIVPEQQQVIVNNVVDTNSFTPERHQKFGGPRIGVTFITPGTTSDYITDKGKHPLVTQFGWQFEQRIFTIENGTSGIVEFIPLIAGMEQGMFLPSANLLIGLRSGGKRSLEFAMGPNISLSGLGMVFAAGTNFRSGKINFPVNVAVVPSVGSKKNETDYSTGITTSKNIATGWRITLTVGFNSRKK